MGVVRKIQAEIEFLKGRQARKRTKLGDFERLVFGRDPAKGADIFIDDETISKTHFALEKRGGQVYLVDLASTNGTCLNGQEVSESPIFNGDVIAVGQTEISFICPQLTNPAKTSHVLLTGGSGHRISTLREQSAELIESLLREKSPDRSGILDRIPEAFIEIGNILATELDISRLSRHVVKIILDIFDADRAIIVSAEKDAQGFKPIFGQTAKGVAEKFPPDISKKVIEDSIASGQSVVTVAELPLSRKARPEDRRVINMLSCPFAGLEKLKGAIYIDASAPAAEDPGKPAARGFEKQHMQLLQAIASQVGTAIERASLTSEKFLSEEMYRLLVEAANDWIFQLDSAGSFTFLNSRTEKIFGLPIQNLLKKPIFDFLSPGSAEKNREQIRKTLETGAAQTFESEISNSSGERRLMSISLAAVENKPGEILGALGVGRDITMEREVQEQLSQAERLSSMGKLVSGMAHELNNPLTSIIGFAQLMNMDQKLAPDVRDKSGLIFKEGERAKEIVQNLLTFAQPLKSRKSPVSINSVVQRVLNLEKFELESAGIAVIVILNESLPEVLGDLNQLMQVFVHIINNARLAIEDAGRSGRIVVKSWQILDTVHVSVADDGVGIKPQNIGRIFDPFFTTREVGKGTGLGLSTCYKIIMSHGGSISVNSEFGRGATFEVVLPALNTTIE